MPDRLAQRESLRTVVPSEQRAVPLLFVAGPQHPRGEGAVEQRLDQGRTEEMLPALALDNPASVG